MCSMEKVVLLEALGKPGPQCLLSAVLGLAGRHAGVGVHCETTLALLLSL